MTPLDRLELDVLAATGDVEMAEMAGLACYMLGLPPERVDARMIVIITDGPGCI